MDCWAKIWKDEGPRAFFKVCLWIEKKNTASGHPSFTGQLHKRAPLNWLRSGACRIRWVYRSPQGIRLAHQCQHHKRPQDKIWSCYQIKIMSPSLQHATPFSRPVWLPLSFWFDHIYYSRARNTPVLTDPGILLGICQEILPDPRFCVYTKLWEFNPKWNKLCYLNWNWIGWLKRGGWFW